MKEWSSCLLSSRAKQDAFISYLHTRLVGFNIMRHLADKKKTTTMLSLKKLRRHLQAEIYQCAHTYRFGRQAHPC